MRFTKILLACFGLVWLAGPWTNQSAVPAGSTHPAVIADGSEPFPKPPSLADGSEPFPKPPSVADGSEPFPKPPQGSVKAAVVA
jgi:hypothetical protein